MTVPLPRSMARTLLRGVFRPFVRAPLALRIFFAILLVLGIIGVPWLEFRVRRQRNALYAIQRLGGTCSIMPFPAKSKLQELYQRLVPPVTDIYVDEDQLKEIGPHYLQLFPRPKLHVSKMEIFDIIGRRDFEEVVALVEKYPILVHARDQHGHTPLHMATQVGHLKLVQYLIEKGALPDEVNVNDCNVLHVASGGRVVLGPEPVDSASIVEVVTYLLHRYPELANKLDRNGLTPFATAKGRLTNAASREDGPGALQIADDERMVDFWGQIVSIYVDRGADYDLEMAIARNDLARVKVLLSQPVDKQPHETKEKALQIAAFLRRHEICEYLIGIGADQSHDQSKYEYPPLLHHLEDVRLVQILLRTQPDLQARIVSSSRPIGTRILQDETTILHHAAARGVPETIALLLELGADLFATSHDLPNLSDSSVSDVTRTPIEVAAMLGRFDTARTLLSHPKFSAGSQEVRQEIVDRSLFGAADTWVELHGSYKDLGSQPKAVAVLLEFGANPQFTREGVTVMQAAVRHLDLKSPARNAQIEQIVRQLADRGASIDLYSAVAIGDYERVNSLIQTDPALANSRHPDGRPALHEAIWMKDLAMVRALLDAGADRNVVDQDGKTALELAKEIGFSVAVPLLSE